MKIIQTEKDFATIAFTRDELGTLGNALNEVRGCIEEWEFQTRMGVTRTEAEELMREIGKVVKQCS
jgi:hypothetical protein